MPRAKSASLLTQALATNYEADEHSSTSFTNSPDTLSPPQDISSQKDSWRNGLPNPEFGPQLVNMTRHSGPTSRGDVAGCMPTAISLGSTPISTSTQFNMDDMRNVNSLLMSHREFLSTAKGRGTSLERTEKEKRVQELPKGTYSTNPGDTGMTRTSTPLSPPIADSISATPPTEGVRAQYRSWRDARPVTTAEKAWSIGGHGSDDSQGGQVEKSIAEALAGVEPNNRSRKASHSLRFFREGLPEDKSLKRDNKNRGRSKDGLNRGQIHTTSDQSKLKTGPQSPRDDIEPQASSLAARPSSPSQSVPEQSTHVLKQEQNQVLNPTEGLATQVGYFDSSHIIEAVTDAQLKAMPAQLLDDIRKHHNLTPGAAKGSSFSRSIPVTASERPESITAKSEIAGEGSVVIEAVKTIDKTSNETDMSHVKGGDEEDDSGEEQISSALFVPHKTPHESPERETDRDHSDLGPGQEHPHDNLNSQWLEEHAVPSRDVDEKYLSQEVKSRPLTSPVAPKSQSTYFETDATLFGIKDLAETERDSQDDGGYTTLGEDSGITDDDPDTTPTGSLKPVRQVPIATNHRLHEHQQKPKQPLETIELIPYRHQVGGHTTMWRFSKRAVCKQLNNRENEFYETVEQYHPELLKFLPRYVYFNSPPNLYVR